MDAGIFDKRLTVMQHIQDSNGDFSWVSIRRMWAALSETDSRNVYSNYAFGTQGAEIKCRYTQIPCGTMLTYGDKVYMVTSCINDRLYSHIKAARVLITQCTLYRYESTKDELNRQRQTKSRILSFPAVLGEKYVRPSESETHHEVTQGIVATTHKAVVLREGDILTVGDIGYIVRVCHTQDPDKNDYEIERTADV